jgi:hypothetical protein
MLADVPDMVRIVLVLLLCTAPASVLGEWAERCMLDAFGNAVCLDKDGVQHPASSAEAERVRRDAGATEAVGDPSQQPGGQGKAQKRCATDQFGNLVCSQ